MNFLKIISLCSLWFKFQIYTEKDWASGSRKIQKMGIILLQNGMKYDYIFMKDGVDYDNSTGIGDEST